MPSGKKTAEKATYKGSFGGIKYTVNRAVDRSAYQHNIQVGAGQLPYARQFKISHSTSTDVKELDSATVEVLARSLKYQEKLRVILEAIQVGETIGAARSAGVSAEHKALVGPAAKGNPRDQSLFEIILTRRAVEVSKLASAQEASFRKGFTKL